MEFVVFVYVCPIERFVWFGRRAKGKNHSAVDFFHHFGLFDADLIFPGGRRQLTKSKSVLLKFRCEEPVKTRRISCRMDIWIYRLRNKSIFLDEILRVFRKSIERCDTVTISNCPPSPTGEERKN
jgi:hypothetical protein